MSYFKDQYKNDIHFLANSDIPYLNEISAIERINIIYSTARKGRLNNNLCNRLWALLSQIHAETNLIPITKSNYDKFAKTYIKEIATIISINQRLRLGVAQKIFNLFMKDLWAWHCLNRRQEKVLHFPLDRRILAFVRNNPWPAWTNIIANQNTFDDSFATYLNIQNILRDQMRHFNFDSPLALDQYLWHKFV
jgi:hypothetical protein